MRFRISTMLLLVMFTSPAFGQAPAPAPDIKVIGDAERLAATLDECRIESLKKDDRIGLWRAYILRLEQRVQILDATVKDLETKVPPPQK